MKRIELYDGDITSLEIDAIVNAANSSLLGGGGVDGAIHRAAGPGLLAECRGLGGCPPGQARITAGHRLAARHVIHTVGPVWRGGGNGESEVLASCYRNCFALVRKHRIASVAFPAISTGVYRFPKELAARICVRECQAAIKRSSRFPARIVLVCFNPETRQAYEEALACL